jgi:hypothetical protein
MAKVPIIRQQQIPKIHMAKVPIILQQLILKIRMAKLHTANPRTEMEAKFHMDKSPTMAMG